MSLLKNAYALLIGISYEDGLDTIGDAEDVAELLRDPSLCGYPAENVLLVTGAEADRKGILGAFDQLIERTNSDSSVFLYYSGHGDVLDGVFHFVPHGIVADMEYDDYTAAWVTAEDVREKINHLATRRLIFFMDCCHATGMAVGGFCPRFSKESESAGNAGQEGFAHLEGLAQKVDNERGISVVASCKEEQESYQLNGDRNSLFTKHLLLALKGGHLTDFTDPYVRILEVAGYLLRVIPETIEQVARDCDPPLDIRQEPYVNLEMYDNFILSYIPEEIRTKLKTTTALEPVEMESRPKSKDPRMVFRESEDANNLILFIHGFDGESTETFGKLPDLLMSDPELDGWDMKPFGYSRFIRPEHGKHVWGGIKDLKRITDYLKTSVKYRFEKYDRIAIIAHGLGGLIAQRGLLDMPAERRNKVSHLILLGCPSNGLSPEELKADWNKGYTEMSSEGEFITALRDDWEAAYGDGYPFDLKVAAALDDPFVSVESSFSRFPETHCFTLEGDHFSMVKPESKEDTAYRLVRHSLTHSDLFAEFGDPKARNLALGRYGAVARELLPDANSLDKKGLRQLIFALEGLGRREEALELLESHPLASRSTDLMGILAGRYKRAYLKRPNRQDGETAQVYYGIALDMAREAGDTDQIYYHAINLAFLSLVMDEDRESMLTYAQQAQEAAEQCAESLWTAATLGEAHLYLDNMYAARNFYEKASKMAGIREKISIHLNAHAAYSALRETGGDDDAFLGFLNEKFLS